MRKSLWFILLSLTLGACAKIVTPTGGPQDTTPPKMLKEEPVSGSVRISNPIIKITFDEFFTLNNPTENILISPPLEHQPSFTIQNKTLVIKFKDTLRANTTYNMVFSNCLQDYHESNKIGYYHYSFSTGDKIDDHMLSGTVTDAQTLAPCDNYFVFLYDQDIDSLPQTTIPTYLTKTQSNGSFNFQNIKPGSYKVFALKDGNGDLLYNLPNESIAFADQMYEAYPAPIKDTSAKVQSAKNSTPTIELSAFVAADSVPILMHYENSIAGLYQFPYKSPVMQFIATPLDHDVPHFEIINPLRDTITWFFKEPLLDTLSYLFSADGHDDTVQITPYKPKKVQSRGSKASAPNRLYVALLNQGHRFRPLTLSFNYPIKPSDSIPVTVITHQKSQSDTSFYHISIPDSFVTKISLPIIFEDKKRYTVLIADSVFYGYNTCVNDSIRTSFVTQSEKDYGSLIMNYTVPETGYQYIAQLKNGNTTIQEDILKKSQTIQYKYLAPGNYSITLIEDRNRNGRWDTGNYLTKLQPERLLKYPAAISIRAFWDNEETFEIPDTRQ